MTSLLSFRFLPAILAGALVAAPLTSEARKVEVRRDLDGDGHYNTKTYQNDRGRYYGNRYSGSRYYGGSRYSGSRYYGGYGYGRPYSYGRSYGYGSGYGRSYYSRPYYSYGPSIGVSYYSRPSYSSRSYVYDDAPSYSSYADDLAVDVQRALKRRGYYRGSVDGDIGPGSRSAIRAYQADRGLPISGRIDSRLLRALGIG